MSHISEYLREQLAPYMTTDFGSYNDSIAAMFDQLDLYAGLEAEELGWGTLLDPELCPAPALPYLAQFIGERIPDGFTEAQQRAWIIDHPNQRRGTVLGIVAAVQRVLTGSGWVAIAERMGDESDVLGVRTLVDQTPSEELVMQELLGVVPADIALDYDTYAGVEWDDVDSAYASWTAVAAASDTWADVLATLVGYTVYTTS